MKHKRSLYSEFSCSNKKPFLIWLNIHKTWTRFASKWCKLFFSVKLELMTSVFLNKLNFCCGYYSRAETIWGNTVVLWITHHISVCIGCIFFLPFEDLKIIFCYSFSFPCNFPGHDFACTIGHIRIRCQISLDLQVGKKLSKIDCLKL
jgi:hypothetical protein